MAEQAFWGTVALVIAAMATAFARERLPPAAWMPGAAIRSEFTGRPIAGIYPSGRPWTETIHSDGTTDYREGGKHWLGRWWIRDREFCFSYPPPGLGGCFRVVRTSANCYELYDFSGEAGRGEEPPHLDDLWNGRLWVADRPTTCEERPTV
jgi:hypothetical protein